MSPKEIQIKNLSMFYPKTKKGLVVDYPELSKLEYFPKLNKFEMLFTWYYACRSSPFDYEEDLRVKAEKSLIEAFGEKKADAVRSKYMAGNFPENLRMAIIEMQNFQPGPRIRAKMMVEKMMVNFEKYVDQDIKKDFKDDDTKGDSPNRKSYIDSCAKISSIFPTLIAQAEGGFSITEKKEGEVVELDSEKLIDKFHNSIED